MDNNLSSIIQGIAKSKMASIQHISENGYKQIKEFAIDCSTLKDYNLNDIRKSPEHQDFFQQLALLTGPVLYVFEITSDTTPKTIVDGIQRYAANGNSKSIPAIKKTYPTTNILYIGKVEKNFWGRVIQHLGYYKVARTQGLQLFYWAKPLGLKLKLIAMEFEKNSEHLMPIFEKGLAGKLQPILGKHK